MIESQVPKLILTDRAERRVAFLRESQRKPGLRLRITVSGGGCSGFRYAFALDEQQAPDDLLFSCAITDAVSLSLMPNAEVDFIENLMGSYFQIKNPVAASSCGCGESFAVRT